MSVNTTRMGMNRDYFEEVRAKNFKLFISKNLVGGFDELVLRPDIPAVFLNHVIELRKGYVVPATVAAAFYSEAGENGLTLPNTFKLLQPFFVAGASFSKIVDQSVKKAVVDLVFCNHLIGEVNDISKIEELIVKQASEV